MDVNFWIQWVCCSYEIGSGQTQEFKLLHNHKWSKMLNLANKLNSMINSSWNVWKQYVRLKEHYVSFSVNADGLDL